MTLNTSVISSPPQLDLLSKERSTPGTYQPSIDSIPPSLFAESAVPQPSSLDTSVTRSLLAPETMQSMADAISALQSIFLEAVLSRISSMQSTQGGPSHGDAVSSLSSPVTAASTAPAADPTSLFAPSQSAPAQPQLPQPQTAVPQIALPVSPAPGLNVPSSASAPLAGSQQGVQPVPGQPVAATTGPTGASFQTPVQVEASQKETSNGYGRDGSDDVDGGDVLDPVSERHRDDEAAEIRD